MTSYGFTTTGTSNDWLSDITLRATYPGGTAYTLGATSFGGNGPGAWNVSRGPDAFGGSAEGIYQFIWADGFDEGTVDPDNSISTAVFTIEYSNTLRTQTTDGAGAPPNLVTAADGITLEPGEIMTVTFDVTIDAGASGILTNTATADAAALPATVSDSVDIAPTAVTIGNVELSAESVADFLAELGVEQMDGTTLLALLESWDPAQAAMLTGTDPSAVLEALQWYLDPDGDGQVAVLDWDTLEERGTIGFYVDRRENDGTWVRVNDDMLPGLITAPLGGEYRLADPRARSGTAYQYQLIEQEASGSTRSYGPYTVEMGP